MSGDHAPVPVPDTTIHGFMAACDGLGWKVRHNISCREIEVFFEGAWRVLSEKHLLSQIVDTLALRCVVRNSDGTCRVAKFTRQNVEQHLETLSECNRYNELQTWLDSLPEWDGRDRISGLFADMFGTGNTPLNRWAANAVFWQVVDRIVEGQHGGAGVSHRATVLFAGAQTVGKTAFVRELLPKQLRGRYLVEGLNFRMGRDELLRICSGRLLVEVGEFGVGADLEDTKAFITAARDNVNHKYQRPYTTARSFVMVGGFNPEQDSPLARDLSGNSRFVVAGDGWTAHQRDMIDRAAVWVYDQFGDTAPSREVAGAMRRMHQQSLRQQAKRLLARHDLLTWWTRWEDVYGRRSGLFHGGASREDGDVAELAEDAMKVCGGIVLCIAKRQGALLPNAAKVHFGAL